MVNRVILIGNLGGDPEVRRLDSGQVVAKFSLATNESYQAKNGEWQQNTEWHNVVLWGKQAEKAEAKFKKGMAIYLEGKLTHRTWEGDDGQKKYFTEVVGSQTRIISGGKDSSGGASNGQYFPSADSPYASAGQAAVEEGAVGNGPGEKMPWDD